jgi:hypothetical protein
VGNRVSAPKERFKSHRQLWGRTTQSRCQRPTVAAHLAPLCLRGSPQPPLAPHGRIRGAGGGPTLASLRTSCCGSFPATVSLGRLAATLVSLSLSLFLSRSLQVLAMPQTTRKRVRHDQQTSVSGRVCRSDVNVREGSETPRPWGGPEVFCWRSLQARDGRGRSDSGMQVG